MLNHSQFYESLNPFFFVGVIFVRICYVLYNNRDIVLEVFVSSTVRILLVRSQNKLTLGETIVRRHPIERKSLPKRVTVFTLSPFTTL